MRDAASYIETPQKTTGELLRTRASIIFKPHEFDGTLHQLLALCRILNIQAAEVIDVLLHAQLFEHRDILRTDADAAASGHSAFAS